MINKIRIKNFRSIKEQEVELAPLVVIYGPTASGKSSLLYSFICLKNFIHNPNQQLDGFFNITFINLGGFDEIVFNKKKDSEIEFTIHLNENEYSVSFSRQGGKVSLKTIYENSKIELTLEIPIPYGLNQNFSDTIKVDQDEYTINWNGITANVSPKQPSARTNKIAFEIAKKINSVVEIIKKIDIIPYKRGFFQPYYSPSSITHNPVNQNEVATIIMNDPNLAPKISHYLEKIAGREFRLYTPPGTATVYFQTTDKKSIVPSYLVNDGFGINQLVYMLAKILRPEIEIILAEEPEIHLHPTIIRNLVKTLCSIIKDEEKQIILTTHSEQFASSLLTAVKNKIISPSEIKLYLTQKEKRETVFYEQKVNEKGQVEGGLSSFIESELEDLKTMLGIEE